MSYKNFGVDGSTITTNLGKSSIFSKLETMLSEYPNADYIILEGGTNDADIIKNDLSKIGSITSSYNSDFDTDTFCGAVEATLSKCVREWKGKKIGFIIAQKMGRSNTGFDKDNNNRRKFFEIIIQACIKWGVPYLNLWDECYFNPNIVQHYNPELSPSENENQGYIYRDGQHLTPIAYNYLSTKISQWMKAL